MFIIMSTVQIFTCTHGRRFQIVLGCRWTSTIVLILHKCVRLMHLSVLYSVTLYWLSVCVSVLECWVTVTVKRKVSKSEKSVSGPFVEMGVCIDFYYCRADCILFFVFFHKNKVVGRPQWYLNAQNQCMIGNTLGIFLWLWYQIFIKVWQSDCLFQMILFHAKQLQ